MATSVEQPLTNGYHNGHAENLADEESSMSTKTVANNQPSQQSTSNPGTLKPSFVGTNQILPATKYSSTQPNGRVLLRIGKEGLASEPPLSVPGLFNRTVARYPDKIAYASKSSTGTWEEVTYKEYLQQVRICAKAFMKLGLERHHSVCILGFNCPQWFIADLAAIYAGGFAAGIYTTNNAEACFHILNDSRANIVVVEDTKQMDKIRAVWSRLPHLKVAIQWDGNISEPKDNIYTWSQIMEWGKEEPDMPLNEIIESICVNECCTLVYTSGTVGQPKGTMLSHDNVTWQGFSLSYRMNVETAYEKLISYLPLSHVAAQILDIYIPITIAATVYFADKDALKGSLINTIQNVQPTRFLGVPRVWEKIYEKMNSIGAANGFLKKLIAGWAKGRSLAHHMNLIQGINSGVYGFWLAQMLVLSRVKAALGFTHCKTFLTAAAPLSPEIKLYFISLDMPIMDVFGMSESAGGHSFGIPSEYNVESVGKPFPGVETRLDNPDSNGEGEICMRGRHIFMGYLNEPQKTQDALDADGWLHSGDLGKIDKDGFLYITGRIKELLITAGGENVAPVPIEQEIKKALPCISQAVVIGDKKKFLSVLLTFKAETDLESGMPLDKLSNDSIRWLQNIGAQVSTVTEILNGPNDKIFKAIEEGIAHANEHAISNAQKVQKFAILPHDLSIATEELGPTMKLKRNVITSKYSNIIESLYNV